MAISQIDSTKRDYLVVTVLIVVFSVGFRLLNDYNFHTSALLYVGFPFLIGIVLLLFTGRCRRENWKVRYWNHTRAALIVMLVSSVVLFEGFLCVLMFMPIYFGVIFLCFFIEFLYRRCSKSQTSTLRHYFSVNKELGKL